MSQLDVLSVDDEGRVLEGLRRMLAFERRWQVHFASSGAGARAVERRTRLAGSRGREDSPARFARDPRRGTWASGAHATLPGRDA